MKKKTKIWIGVACVAVVGVVLAAVLGKPKEVAVIKADTCAVGTIENTVTATGEIQPVYKVEVGTQVSGIVEKLYVDYNSEVKKGQLLAELDKSTLLEQVKQAKANLSTMQSNRLLAQKNFDRVKKLYEQKAATQEEYDQAETNLEQAKNQQTTAQSNYDRSLTDLKYAEIYSPIDGVILSKAVEEGQTVASSFSTPTLFTIAKNLTDMQLEAKIDEADIGQVKEGQAVRFTVDAFAGVEFQGTVRQIRLVPTVTSNVVTYTVIIDAPNDDGKLYPGMTANITILVDKEDGLLVPLEATQLDLDAQMVEFLREQGYEVQAADTTQKGTLVWVLEGKRLSVRDITTGVGDGVNLIVTKGLEGGEQVVRSITRQKKGEGKDNNQQGGMRMGPPMH